MLRLKRLLSASNKSRRHRRNILNIMVTILEWAAESLGFLTILIGTHILGHENNVINLIMQSLSTMIFFVIIPSVLLMSNSESKSIITESYWYHMFLSSMNLNYQYTDQEESNGPKMERSNLHPDQEDNTNVSVVEEGDNNTGQVKISIHQTGRSRIFSIHQESTEQSA